MAENQVTISKEELVELQQAKQTLAQAKEKQRNQWQRRNAKLMIFKTKAEAKGITVTEEEIDKYLNK